MHGFYNSVRLNIYSGARQEGFAPDTKGKTELELTKARQILGLVARESQLA